MPDNPQNTVRVPYQTTDIHGNPVVRYQTVRLKTAQVTPTPPPQEPTSSPSVLRGFTGAAGGIFKGIGKSQIFQIFMWSIVSELMSGAAAPFLQQLSNYMNKKHPTVPLTPSEVATAENRDFIAKGEGAPIAALSGINEKDYSVMKQLAGTAPAPSFLAEAHRRGLIPMDSGDPNQPGFVQGVKQGNIRDMWMDAVRGLTYATPSPTDVLDAYLEGQIEEGKAKELYKLFGGATGAGIGDNMTDEWFTMMYNTRGSAPSPLEAAEMTHRGYIPKTGTGAGVISYNQAFLEGPWRNKWSEVMWKLSERLPTAPEVSSFVSEGVWTQKQGADMLQKLGMSPESATAFLHRASATKTSSTKALAESTTTKLYYEQIIDHATAKKFLENLKYTSQEADFILQITDLTRESHALSQATSRLHTLYVDHKINATTATNALNQLQIPANQVQSLLELWHLERVNNVKTLTMAEIRDAFHIGIIDQGQAEARLQEIGYQPHDAWLLLSVKEKTKLPGEPPQDAITAGNP
jgi:hypothetical protein